MAAGGNTEAGGRPMKLDDALHDRIVTVSKTGMGLVEAAIASGVTRRTALKWERRGNEAMTRVTEGGEGRAGLTETDRACLRLVEDVQEAHAQSKAFLLGILTNAARNDRTSAQWMLERVHGMAPTPRVRKRDSENPPGRPVGAVSAPDRKVVQSQPPRLRLAGE